MSRAVENLLHSIETIRMAYLESRIDGLTPVNVKRNSIEER